MATCQSSKPIQIWHALNGARYHDTMINMNGSGTATFTQRFTSTGTCTCTRDLRDDTWYRTFTSSAVTVKVH